MININKIIYDNKYQIIKNDKLTSYDLKYFTDLFAKIVRDKKDSEISEFEKELYLLIISFIKDNIYINDNVSLFFNKDNYIIDDRNLLRYTFSVKDKYKYVSQINNFNFEYNILYLIYNFLEYVTYNDFSYLEISFNRNQISFSMKIKNKINNEFIKKFKDKFKFKTNNSKIKYFNDSKKCEFV